MAVETVPLTRFELGANYVFAGVLVALGLWSGWEIIVSLASTRTNFGDWLILLFPAASLGTGIYIFIWAMQGPRVAPFVGHRKGPRLFFRTAAGGALVVNIWLLDLLHRSSVAGVVISVIAIAIALLLAWAFWGAVKEAGESKADPTESST